MSDDLFDFDSDDSEKVDSTEATDDTSNTESAVSTPKPKAATKKPRAKAAAKKARSGKTSGKTTGSVSRQKQRVPMYQRQPLEVRDRDPNFEYRVVKGDPERVRRFKLAGWVEDEKSTVGDDYAGQASSMGSVTSKPVGGGRIDIVMKIPKELYEEDQAAKQREVDRTEEAMLQDAASEINKAAGNKDEWAGEIKLNKAAVTK